MSIYNPTTKFNPSRNSFDRTYRSTFTTAGGQLLPVFSQFMNPGDKLRLKISHLTNADNLNKAAFARMEEHYDAFFVPIKQLWQWFPEMIVKTDQPITMANQAWFSSASGEVPLNVPNFDLRAYYQHIYEVDDAEGPKDDLGYVKAVGAEKLLDYFKYSNKSKGIDYALDQETTSLYCNLWKPLAYQKIYNDFYRDSNWERPNVGSFNVDDCSGLGSSVANVITNNSRLDDIFRLRYVNLKKDYFTGLRPSQTYGDVSIVSGNVFTSTIADSTTSISLRSLGGSGVVNTGTAAVQGDLKTQISMLELRQAQALQRWKDVTLSNRKDYSSQIEAHFDVKTNPALSRNVRFIEGVTSNLNIDQVTQTSVGTSDETMLGARGANMTGFDTGEKVIEWESKEEYGVFMVIYYILPLPDFSPFGVDRMNTKLSADDYFIPEFENIGLQPIEWYELMLYNGQPDSRIPLGYSNRYLEYKGAYDEVHDEFAYGASKDEFVIQFDTQTLDTVSDIDYTFFKAKPSMLSNLFAVPYSGTLASEPFRNTTYFDFKHIRNMSVDGMPY